MLAGAFLKDNEAGAYLGNLAPVTDSERKGLALALYHAPSTGKLCILTDYMTSLNSAPQLSRREPRDRG